MHHAFPREKVQVSYEGIFFKQALKHFPREKVQVAIKFGITGFDVSGMRVKGTPDHSHKVPGSTGSRNGVEGRGSSFYKIVVRRGYTSMER